MLSGCCDKVCVEKIFNLEMYLAYIEWLHNERKNYNELI